MLEGFDKELRENQWVEAWPSCIHFPRGTVVSVDMGALAFGFEYVNWWRCEPRRLCIFSYILLGIFS